MQKSVHFTMYTFFLYNFCPIFTHTKLPYINKYIGYEKNWLH
jgi:hypothetical protein